MGNTLSRVGSRVGPNGTQFIGNIQGRARNKYNRDTLQEYGSRILFIPTRNVSILS